MSESRENFRCEMCMGSCKVEDGDISMFDFATLAKPDSRNIFLCASCAREVETYVRSRRMDFQI